MSKKYVYLFSEGNANMRELLGGKGANLAEMSNIGLPVPQGFTITTEACTQYYEDGRQINDSIMAEIMKNVEIMEQINGKKFGDLKNPLLVSVRSGARASMPGMMDTILNLGLNDDVVAAMIAGNPDPKFERFVYDSYRRFIQMFSDVVMEVGKKYFEQLIDQMKERKGVTFDVELTAADLKALAQEVAANATKYNATQWAEVKDKAAAILANVKAANLSGDEVTKLTETVNGYLNSSTASLASKALEAVTGSAPVQGAVEAVTKGQEAVDAANAKVEEGKAAVENAKAAVDEKVQKGKEQVEATKKNVEAVGEAAKGTVDAAKKLLGK